MQALMFALPFTNLAIPQPLLKFLSVLPISWSLLPLAYSHYFQNKPNTKKFMGIFQWENFQNHQRLKLPYHNWKSPPKRREINLSSSWACQLKHRLPLMQNCHKAIPNELNHIIRSSPSLPLVWGVFTIGLLEPRHSFAKENFPLKHPSYPNRELKLTLAVPKMVLSYVKTILKYQLTCSCPQFE